MVGTGWQRLMAVAACASFVGMATALGVPIGVLAPVAPAGDRFVSVPVAAFAVESVGMSCTFCDFASCRSFCSERWCEVTSCRAYAFTCALRARCWASRPSAISA